MDCRNLILLFFTWISIAIPGAQPALHDSTDTTNIVQAAENQRDSLIRDSMIPFIDSASQERIQSSQDKTSGEPKEIGKVESLSETYVLDGVIISQETVKFPTSLVEKALIDSLPLIIDTSGYFSFANISLGTHIITIQARNHQPFTRAVIITPDKKNYFITCKLQKKSPGSPGPQPLIKSKADSVSGPPWTITGCIVDSRFDLPIEDKEFFMLFDQDTIPITKKGIFKIKTHYRGLHTIRVTIPGYHDIIETITLTDEVKQPFIVLPTTLLEHRITKRKIIVWGKRQPVHVTSSVAKTKITRKDMERTTATLGDPIRLLHTLPSVHSGSDISSRPVVRGGDVLESRVFIDGVALIQPYHFGGVRSTFNQVAMENLNFYKSGFPARFHNAQSAIISAQSRLPANDSFHLEFDLNLLQYNAYISIPFSNHTWGINGSVQGSYMDFVSKTMMSMVDNDFAEEYKETVNQPDYQDFSFGLQVKPGDRFTFYINELLNTDRFKITDRDSVYPVVYYYNNKFYKIVNGEVVIFKENSEPGLRDTSFSITRHFDPYTPDLIIENNAPYPYLDSWKRMPGEVAVDTTLLYYSNYNVLYATGQYQASEHNIFTLTTAWQKRWWDVTFPSESFAFALHSKYDIKIDQINANFNWIYSGFKKNIFSSGFQLDYTIVPFDVYMARPLHEIVTKGSTNFADYWGPLTQDTGAIFYPLPDTLQGSNYNDIIERLYVNYKGKEKYYNAAVHIEDDITFNKRLHLTLGARLEYSSLDHSKTVSPRASSKFSINDKHELIGSLGLYTQNNYDVAALALSAELKPEKVWHMGLGIESRLLPWLTQKIDGFGKYYYDLVSEHIEPPVDPFSPSLIQALSNYFTTMNIDSLLKNDIEYYIKLAREFLFSKSIYFSHYTNNGRGYVLGFEYFLRYDPTDFWHGWLSLSFNRSMRQRHPDWRWHPFPLDRPFQLSLVNYYRLPRKYEISVKYRLMSGIPYTGTNISFDFDDVSDTLIIDPYNNKRYDWYQSLDFKIAKGFSIGRGKGHWYLETWNALNTPNMFLRDKDSHQTKAFGMNLPYTAIFIGIDYKL